MKTVLIVDDDPEISRSLANLFDSQRFRFYFLDDGQNMVEFVKEKNDVDVVLLDVNLPTLSGLDILKTGQSARSQFPDYYDIRICLYGKCHRGDARRSLRVPYQTI